MEEVLAHAGNTDIRAWVGMVSKPGYASPAVRGTPKRESFFTPATRPEIFTRATSQTPLKPER